FSTIVPQLQKGVLCLIARIKFFAKFIVKKVMKILCVFVVNTLKSRFLTDVVGKFFRQNMVFTAAKLYKYSFSFFRDFFELDCSIYKEYIFIQLFMRISFQDIALFALSFSLLFSSCRKEETQLITPPEDETLAINSPVVNLIKQTISNDGSVDNIIDNANCFKVKLPVTVGANNIEIEVNSEMDYETIEDVFAELDDDEDIIEIYFPITIILEDYSLVNINNYSELSNFSSNCNGETIADDDIECVDFQYPFSVSVFKSENEIIDTATFTYDEDFYLFIAEIAQYDIVTMDFPIAVSLSDGTNTNVQNLNELQAILETYRDSCDEDDDNNYNDDDCNECTTSQLAAYLTGCQNWIVDRLRRDESTNTEDYYDGYVFNFYT